MRISARQIGQRVEGMSDERKQVGRVIGKQMWTRVLSFCASQLVANEALFIFHGSSLGGQTATWKNASKCIGLFVRFTKLLVIVNYLKFKHWLLNSTFSTKDILTLNSAFLTKPILWGSMNSLRRTKSWLTCDRMAVRRRSEESWERVSRMQDAQSDRGRKRKEIRKMIVRYV